MSIKKHVSEFYFVPLYKILKSGWGIISIVLVVYFSLSTSTFGRNKLWNKYNNTIGYAAVMLPGKSGTSQGIHTLSNVLGI